MIHMMIYVLYVCFGRVEASSRGIQLTIGAMKYNNNSKLEVSIDSDQCDMYYVEGVLNNINMKFVLSFDHSAIYIYDNVCNECNMSVREQDHMMSIKNVINTIVKYCKVTYRSCDEFYDRRYDGFVSIQRLVFEDWAPSKFSSYYVTGYTSGDKGLFGIDNIFGIMGIGRLDTDEKYIHNTLDELISSYSLETRNILIHLLRSSTITFGRYIDYNTINKFRMVRCDIVDTNVLSIDIQYMNISFGNGTYNIMENTSFVLDINRKNNKVKYYMVYKIASQARLTLVELGYQDSIVDSNKSHIMVRTNSVNISYINSKNCISYETQHGTINDCHIFIKHRQHDNDTCDYILSYVIGDDNILAISMLNGRLLDIYTDMFYISDSPVSKDDVWNIHMQVDNDSYGKMTFVLMMFAVSLVMMYKSCEGCSKSLIQDVK